MLRVLATGMLGAAAGPAWDGWCFARGELVSPEQECFTPGELLADRMLARQWRRDYDRRQRPGYQQEMF